MIPQIMITTIIIDPICRQVCTSWSTFVDEDPQAIKQQQ
jgi:hypothetical protein